MKLYFLKQKSLDMLEQTIPDNLNKYQDAETWVDQYFIDNDKPNYFFDTGIEVDDYQLISGGPETDFSNAKILYEALQGHINLVQASDLRLWAYMAHKQHWDYMHTRWGIDLPDDEDEAEENETKKSSTDKAIDRIGTRYFFKSITGEYVKGFEDGEPIYFKGSDAKPKPKLTYTLQDPSFDKVFVKVKSWLINLPSGVTEIEIYKVSDVTNRQLRFNRMREYLIDHIGEYVFSRAKRDMKLVYADEKRADFLFPFTEKEYDSMVEKFGKFCVIVNGRELERHINYYCEENECDYIFDKVEYCE